MPSRHPDPHAAPHLRRALALMGLLAVAVPAQSQEPWGPEHRDATQARCESADAKQAAKAFRDLRIEPTETYARVAKVVRGLDWRGSLRSGLSAAAETDRPLLLIQALGDIDGFT